MKLTKQVIKGQKESFIIEAYDAKDELLGRISFGIFTPAMQSKTMQSLTLQEITQIRVVMENFHLFYNNIK